MPRAPRPHTQRFRHKTGVRGNLRDMSMLALLHFIAAEFVRMGISRSTAAGRRAARAIPHAVFLVLAAECLAHATMPRDQRTHAEYLNMPVPRLADWPESCCVRDFRFEKHDIYEMMRCFGLLHNGEPFRMRIRSSMGASSSYWIVMSDVAFMLCLKRLSVAARLYVGSLALHLDSTFSTA